MPPRRCVYRAAAAAWVASAAWVVALCPTAALVSDTPTSTPATIDGVTFSTAPAPTTEPLPENKSTVALGSSKGPSPLPPMVHSLAEADADHTLSTLPSEQSDSDVDRLPVSRSFQANGTFALSERHQPSLPIVAASCWLICCLFLGVAFAWAIQRETQVTTTRTEDVNQPDNENGPCGKDAPTLASGKSHSSLRGNDSDSHTSDFPNTLEDAKGPCAMSNSCHDTSNHDRC